jgi:hypothetical protein
MRNPGSVTCLVGLFVLSGCSSASPLWPAESNRTTSSTSRPDLTQVGKIVLTCGYDDNPPPGAPSTLYELELHAGGPCRGRVIGLKDFPLLADEFTVQYDLPAEDFEECRRLLIASAFFDRKPASPPGRSEDDSLRITVTCDDRYTHSVSVSQPAPSALSDLFSLTSQVGQRGNRVVTPSENRSPLIPWGGGR